MLFFIILCFSLNIFSMERQETSIDIRNELATPKSGSDSSSSEQEELFDFAVSRFNNIREYIRPFFMTVLKEEESHPVARHESAVSMLKKIKSGDEPVSPVHENIIQDLVMKAVGKALEEKEKELAEHQRKMKSRYSRKKTAGIAAIAATCATIVTTICTTLVALNSK